MKLPDKKHTLTYNGLGAEKLGAWPTNIQAQHSPFFLIKFWAQPGVASTFRSLTHMVINRDSSNTVFKQEDK